MGADSISNTNTFGCPFEPLEGSLPSSLAFLTTRLTPRALVRSILLFSVEMTSHISVDDIPCLLNAIMISLCSSQLIIQPPLYYTSYLINIADIILFVFSYNRSFHESRSSLE